MSFDRALRPFFPETCHPTLSRRQFLGAGAAALAFGGFRASPVLCAPSAEDGATIIRRYAGTPEDPWVVAHGLRGMGREFTINGGRRAVDYLLEDVLVSVPANGKSLLGFPVEVEGHSNMFLKTMLEAGVP